MSTTEIEETARSGNRPSGPRAEAREQAILDAALELLMEVGYDRLSMDALAERAHAGKATIYRHWSGKAQVVAEAVRRLKHAGLCVAMTDIESAILVGVLSAMRTDPELADLVRSQINDTKIAQFEVIIAEAVRRGELPQGSSADLIGEVVPALFITRLVVLGQPVDEAFAVHVVDDVALPLLLNP